MPAHYATNGRSRRAVPPSPPLNLPNQGTSGRSDASDGIAIRDIGDVLYPILVCGRAFSCKIDVVGDLATISIDVPASPEEKNHES